MCIAELVSRSDDDVQRIPLHLQTTADVAHGLQPAMQSIQSAQHHLRVAIANVRFDAILNQCQILVDVLIQKDVERIQGILLEVVAKGRYEYDIYIAYMMEFTVRARSAWPQTYQNRR